MWQEMGAHLARELPETTLHTSTQCSWTGTMWSARESSCSRRGLISALRRGAPFLLARSRSSPDFWSLRERDRKRARADRPAASG